MDFMDIEKKRATVRKFSQKAAVGDVLLQRGAGIESLKG